MIHKPSCIHVALHEGGPRSQGCADGRRPRNPPAAGGLLRTTTRPTLNSLDILRLLRASV